MHKVIFPSLHTSYNEPENKEQSCWEYQELSYLGEILSQKSDNWKNFKNKTINH